MPSITAPIFEAGRLEANLDLATREKDVAVVAQYEKTIQSAFREVADGLAARGTYNDQVAALRRNVEAEQRRLDLSEVRVRNGVDDCLSVLTAQTDLYNAHLSLVSAQLNGLTKLVDLYRELGGWIEHLAKRNGSLPPWRNFYRLVHLINDFACKFERYRPYSGLAIFK